jgi:2-polyprenyl-3-methyl-5-hydroxy-6-metoxy-1,4-benzoquinol methylase
MVEQVRGSDLSYLCRCTHCELVSVYPFPREEELRAVYAAEYFKSDESSVKGYDDYESDRPNIVRTAARRLQEIERLVPTGRLLDVGCALGFFLEEARRRGWAVEGIDISAHAIQYAQDRLGLPAQVGTLGDARLAKDSFDVITLWDVIEHLPNPVAELGVCRDLLRPGGLLVLSTPDLESWVAKITGPRWMGFKLADEHIYYFSRKTITLALEKAGFEMVEITTIGKHVTFEFFARRLSMYLPGAASVLALAFTLMGIEDGAIYVDPRDLMRVVARRKD